MPETGIAGTSVTDPGQPATSRAMAITASIPHPIGAKATASRPSGINM